MTKSSTEPSPTCPECGKPFEEGQLTESVGGVKYHSPNCARAERSRRAEEAGRRGVGASTGANSDYCRSHPVGKNTKARILRGM
jgi:hypothetical protein